MAAISYETLRPALKRVEISYITMKIVYIYDYKYKLLLIISYLL